MTEEEKKLLIEIDSLHGKLLQESMSRWNGIYTEEPSGYSYRRNANALLEKVYELREKFNPEYLSGHCVGAYAHTCNKEVSYVEYHHEKAIKKKAPQIRKTELVTAINKSNTQINLDLFSLFLKISELNREPNSADTNQEEVNQTE
jgi:hypothetical protein